jgi:predicted ester cyclase
MRKTIACALLALLAACHPRVSSPIAALEQRYEECWGLFNAQSWEPFGQCYAADAENDAPGSGRPTLKGRDQIIDLHAKPLAMAFPDLKGDLQLVLSDGKYALGLAILTGTHTGNLAGPTGPIPPTNKPIGLLVAHMLHAGASARAADHDWLFLDTGTLLGQLGVNPGPHRAPPAAGKKVVVLARDDAGEKANQAAYQALNAAWNRHDAAAFGAALAGDVVWSTQANPSDTKGDAAVLARTRALWAAFSDARLDMWSVWGAGDYVVGVGAFRGTNDGDLGDRPKSGLKVDLPVLEVVRFEVGKVAQEWMFFNGLSLNSQLGMTMTPMK